MPHFNSMINIAHVHVKDLGYNAFISMDVLTRNIHVFKYSEDRCCCDYEIFETQYECSKYLEEPLLSFKF